MDSFDFAMSNPSPSPDQVMREFIQQLWQGQQPALPPADWLGPWQPLAQVLAEQAARFQQPALLQTTLRALAVREPVLQHWLDELTDATPEPQAAPVRTGPAPRSPPVLAGVRTTAPADDAEDEEIPPLPEAVTFPPAVSAGAWPTLDAYVDYSRQASPEAYEDFHLVVGLWVFSTIAARRIYLPLQHKRVYPTLMLVLVARPSLFAKTTTAQAGRALLRAAGLDWLLLPDRITPQKLLSDLAMTTVPAGYEALPPEQQERLRQRLAMPGQRGWYLDEFGKFVRAALQPRSTMADFIELLLVLESCPPYFEHATLLRGGEVIEQPSLAVLGSMTPASLRLVAQPGAELWHDGFLARFAFAVAPLREIQQQTFAPGEAEPPRELLQRLSAWHRRLGIPDLRLEPQEGSSGGAPHWRMQRGPVPERACQISQEAYAGYDRYRRALRALLASSPLEDLDGAYGRLPELALRLALLNASLEQQDPLEAARIELAHWAKAQELTERFRRHLHRLHAQMRAATGGEDSVEEQLSRFLHRLPAGEAVSIREIQRRAPAALRQLPATRLREALHVLLQAGEVELLQSGSRLLYRFRGQGEEEAESRSDGAG